MNKSPKRKLLTEAMIAAGRGRVEPIYKKYRSRVMRDRILNNCEPARRDLFVMIAARDALARVVGFGYPYDMNRDIDGEILHERDRRASLARQMTIAMKRASK